MIILQFAHHNLSSCVRRLRLLLLDIQREIDAENVKPTEEELKRQKERCVSARQ